MIRVTDREAYPFNAAQHDVDAYCRSDVDLAHELEKLRGQMRDLLPIEGTFTLVRETPIHD